MASIEHQSKFFSLAAKDHDFKDKCNLFFQQATMFLTVKGDESIGVKIPSQLIDHIVEVNIKRPFAFSSSDVFTSLVQITNPNDSVCVITIDANNNPTSMMFILHTGIVYQFMLSGDEWDSPTIYQWIGWERYELKLG